MARFVYIFISFYLCSPVFAADFILWRNLKPSEKLEMMVIDDFEEKVKWKMSNTLGIPSRLRFVYKNPADRDVHNYGKNEDVKNYGIDMGVLKESAKIHGRKFSEDQKFAQELIVFFNNPGTDYQIIEAPENMSKFINGRALAVSVWVFGVKKKHVLYGLFSNQVRENIPVRIGDLNFSGWRRLEVSIGQQVIHRNRLNDKIYQFRFNGFKIVSHPKEPKGNFLFLHDLVSVLVDTDYNNYAGSEIKDGWK
jgi:hypothetical protein